VAMATAYGLTSIGLIGALALRTSV
jgi:hypothetical protein